MPNRDQRRHPDGDQSPRQEPAADMRDPKRPQDTLDPRTKSSGHGKKTADKWNQ